MSIENALARLNKSVNALAGDDTVDMTVEQFVAYATEQVDKAKGESGDARIARLKHLGSQIESVRKNFEGSPATPGGILRVTQFRDPAQVRTTEKTVAAPTNATASSQFSSNDPGPTGTPSTPPGGQMPPMTAGGSGFDSPATATFAKSLDGLSDAIAKMAGEGGDADKGDDKTQPDAKADADDADKGDETDAETDDESDDDADKGDEEQVAKSTGVIWPLDMTSDFGMGKTEDPEEPEWGFDTGSESAKRAEALKAKAQSSAE